MTDEANNRLFNRAVIRMEERGLTDVTCSELAEDLDVPVALLEGVFRDRLGTAPEEFLKNRRLDFALRLIRETRLPIPMVANASGYSGVQPFRDVFRERFGTPPGVWRRHQQNPVSGGGTITLDLRYRPPYGWTDLIAFLAGRSLPGVEHVTDTVYRRTVSLRKDSRIYNGWISVEHRPDVGALEATISDSLLPVLPQTLMRIRYLFDLDCDPDVIYSRIASMNALIPDIAKPGTRLPGCFEPFEMVVRAVLGQQVTVKSARTLASRLTGAFGKPIRTPYPELDRVFPEPETIVELGDAVQNQLGALGIIGSRSRSIYRLAGELLGDTIRLSPSADADLESARLLQLPGFGPWTVRYIGMRALGDTDAFPHTDYGVLKVLSAYTPAQILEMSEAWRPWRAYATINIWNSRRL